MADGDLAEALRRLMERGWRDGRPDARRSGRPRATSWTGSSGDARSCSRSTASATCSARSGTALDEIVATERAGVERRLDSAAATAPTAPSRPTRPIRPSSGCSAMWPRDGSTSSMRCRTTSGSGSAALSDYDFLEPDARDRFDELVATLQRQVLDQFVGGMARRDPVDDARRTSPRTARWSATSTSCMRQRIGRLRARRVASSSRSTVRSSRAPGPSTTSSTSWPSGWRRCSRCCDR